jgi:alginate O-acetyltransferase complex protein AlgI
MLFHTFTFLPFYILFIACYYSFSNPKFRVGVLLFFSNVFYGWWNWKLLGLIWLTIGLDFIISKKIYRANTKKEKFRFLLVTLIVNFSLLGFFKYWNFFMGSFHSIGLVAADRFVVENLILPVGISFYTFQSVSYSLDVYRERLKPVDSIIDYAAYVSFFPQLVAGPIERIESLLPQIVRFNKFDFDHFISGFYLFSQGLFRKALGDILSDLSDPTFKNVSNATPEDIILSIFYFTFQIYFDFSGYSEMARGLARTIGIELMLNFNAPYLSTSFQEFWRRWHISLSTWLRDYLYISLGGSRKGFVLTNFNLMVTMALGGLWHGAGLNYIIWGALHGIYLVAQRILEAIFESLFGISGIFRFKQSYRFFIWKRLFKNAFGWLITFCFVSYTWLYFRVYTVSDIEIVHKKLFLWIKHPVLPVYSFSVVFIFIPMLWIYDILQKDRKDFFRPDNTTILRNVFFGFLSGVFVILSLIFLVGKPTKQFIYFQF